MKHSAFVPTLTVVRTARVSRAGWFAVPHQVPHPDMLEVRGLGLTRREESHP